MLLEHIGHLLQKATLQGWEMKSTYIIHRNKNSELGKMRQQKTIFQIKEPVKIQEEELIEVEISNLPGKEFKVIMIKMLKDLERRLDNRVKS